MCDHSGKLAGKLIAWLDNELPAEEAAEVERHLAVCSECRSDAGKYKRVSVEIGAYCDAAISSSGTRGAFRWAPVASAAAAVAVLVVLFLAMPRTQVKSGAFIAPKMVVAASPAAHAATVPGSLRSVPRTHRRQIAAPASPLNANAAPTHNQNVDMLPDEPMIQIAFPADEMFPPGAVPEGMHFVADLTIAPDGSAERLRLRPRLAGFERRTTLP
jgi:hypothetical protein